MFHVKHSVLATLRSLVQAARPSTTMSRELHRVRVSGDKDMHPRRPLRWPHLGLTATIALFLSTTSQAEVKPNVLFTDNMVLQRDRPVKVWGTAAADEKVKVSFGDQTAEATAKDGKWQVELKPLSAGDPHTLTIEGAQQDRAKKRPGGRRLDRQRPVEHGDEPSLKRRSPIKPSPLAKYPRIRLFTVKHGGSPSQTIA